MKKNPFNTRLQKFLLFLSLGFIPALVEACPRCVDATPYKTGMQIAVAVLLPIPFVLVAALLFWIRRHSEPETNQS